MSLYTKYLTWIYPSLHTLWEGKKIIGLIIFHLFGISDSLFFYSGCQYESCNLGSRAASPQVNCCSLESSGIWRHHNASSATGAMDWTWPTEQRMSVCKVIAGSLTEWERRSRGGEARAFRGKIGRRRMERTWTEHMKSRKIRMAGDGWGSRERGKRECLSRKPAPAGSSGWKLLLMASKERQAV